MAQDRSARKTLGEAYVPTVDILQSMWFINLLTKAELQDKY